MSDSASRYREPRPSVRRMRLTLDPCRSPGSRSSSGPARQARAASPAPADPISRRSGPGPAAAVEILSMHLHQHRMRAPDKNAQASAASCSPGWSASTRTQPASATISCPFQRHRRPPQSPRQARLGLQTQLHQHRPHQIPRCRSMRTQIGEEARPRLVDGLGVLIELPLELFEVSNARRIVERVLELRQSHGLGLRRRIAG